MQELETHISIAGPEKKGGLYMTQIILKMAELKEGTQGIADKKASGEKVVSESAIGPAFARTIRRSGLKTPSKAQWLRCRHPVNVLLIPPLAGLRFPDQPDALPLDLI